MSLRLKLVVLVCVLVAAGLVVSDVVTYSSFQGFLARRTDQQLAGITAPVGRSLAFSAHLVPVPVAATDRPPAPPGGRRDTAIPTGTYGQLRSSDGHVLASQVFANGGRTPDAPSLPATLPRPPRGQSAAYFDTTSHDGTRYRVIARRSELAGDTEVVAVPLADTLASLGHLRNVELVVTLAVVALVSLLGWLLVRREFRPIDDMVEAASAIASGDGDRRVGEANPRTEVGALGVALNAMLASVEESLEARRASEARMRRLLADVSHELRTPLTAIRGFAQLLATGARSDPTRVDTAIARIDAESERMADLIDELLLLATFDEVRHPNTERVDLARIVTEAVESARVAGRGREVDLEIGSPVQVVGDGQHLRRLVDNLVSNALAHTSEADSVAVSVGSEGGRAVVEVFDTGAPIPDDQQPTMFEPFTRADPSRARQTGGAGLGLAIAAAIAGSHGGSVRYVARERGKSFRFEMPAAPRVEG